VSLKWKGGGGSWRFKGTIRHGAALSM